MSYLTAGLLAAADGLLDLGPYETMPVTVHPVPGDRHVVVRAHADPVCYAGSRPAPDRGWESPRAAVEVSRSLVKQRRAPAVESHCGTTDLPLPVLAEADHVLRELGGAVQQLQTARTLARISAGWANHDPVGLAAVRGHALVEALTGPGTPWAAPQPHHAPETEWAQAVAAATARAHTARGALAGRLTTAWPHHRLADQLTTTPDPEVVWVPVPLHLFGSGYGVLPSAMPAVTLLLTAPVVAASSSQVVLALSGSAVAVIDPVVPLPGGATPRPGLEPAVWPAALAMVDNGAWLTDALDAATAAQMVA